MKTRVSLKYFVSYFSFQRPECSPQCPELIVKYPKSSVQGPASKVQRPVSRVQRSESKVQSPASNSCMQSPGIPVCHEKLVNLKMFWCLNVIKYWSCRARKKETIMIWKKWKKIIKKNTQIAWKMFTIAEKSALLYKKFKFLTSLNPSRHQCLLLIFCR